MTARQVRHVLLGIVLATGLGWPTAATTPAGAQPAEAVTARGMSPSQGSVVDQVNTSRRQHRRPALATNGMMNVRAQKWAQHLRSIQNCYDQPCLRHRDLRTIALPGWYAVAENVGRSGNGNSLDALHRAFMRSAGHRANILNRRWTHVGVGVARDKAGEWFVVHAFADYSR